MPAVAQLEWDWTEPTATRGVLLPEVFAKWHRGRNLGMYLADLRLDGHRVGAPALERLNYWLEADGAWRASLVDHFEAEKILADVLRRRRVVNLGRAGAGRWPAGTTADQILRGGG